ncbi:MAG TPA: polysaccharide biosynthesis tyrosine autokinase [Caulobacteraceae bacterium]|nr:polysaccharide biosynthesis tyrosine autokinase [Caulobacteraceae bacterium]
MSTPFLPIELRRATVETPAVGQSAEADAVAPNWKTSTAGEGPELTIVAVQAWRLLARRWPVMAGATAAGAALTGAVTLLMPPSYTAGATLQIDRQTERVVDTQDQTPVDNLGEEFFQTQYGLLRSRSLAERVADSLALTQDDAFRSLMTRKPRGYVWRTGAPGERRGKVIRLLTTHLRVSPQRGSRLVSVAFTSPDPQVSMRIANSFADNFIAAALDRRLEASSYARDFLEKRLAEVKARLETSERALVAYAASQQIVQLPNATASSAPDSGPSLPAANLAAFNGALATARTERIRAEQKWREAEASAGVGLSDILQSPTFQVLSQEHAKLSAEYQDRLRTFKPDYPEMIALKAQVDETARQMAIEAGNIRQALKAQYDMAAANEAALSAQVASLKGAVLDLRGRSIRYNILQREVDTNRTLYDGLLQRYKEVGVAGGVSANNISVVDRAEAPLRPSSPRPLLSLVLGGLAGLGLGVGLALLTEGLDQAVRTGADLEGEFGLPLLGAAPSLRRGARPAEALADARSPMTEAFQAVRMALQFSTPRGFPKSLLVTSPWPGTGKTTTAFAISQLMARLGLRILLIEADLRHPGLGELVAADRRIGLTTVLTGAAAVQDVVQTSQFPNLFVITAGPPAPAPAELLAGTRLAQLAAEAAASFDIVVFDGPPVMGLADAPIIGTAVEGSILVVEAGRTTQRQVREAMRRMAMAGAHVLGVVLNRAKTVPGEPGYGYGDGYGFDYGHGETYAGAAAAGRLARFGRRLLLRP